MVDGLLQKGEQHEERRGPAQGVRGGGVVEARGARPWRALEAAMAVLPLSRGLWEGSEPAEHSCLPGFVISRAELCRGGISRPWLAGGSGSRGRCHHPL